MTTEPPVKVVFVMTFAARLGGCEEFLWTFLRRVDRSRIEPLVLFHSVGPLADEVEALGIPTATVVTGRFRHPRQGVRAISRTRSLFQELRPDLVLSWYNRAHLYTAPAAALAGAGRRLVWFQHSMPGVTDLDRLVTWTPARAILANSEAVAAAQRRHRPRRPTYVVYPGMPDPPALPMEQLAELRGSLGIPPGRDIVGIVGRLQPLKRQHLVIEAVERLRAGGREAHCLVVGGAAHGIAPEYERSLKRLVDERGLGGAVTFTGQVPDAGPYIQLMDVLVNATTREGFGLVLVEALALGVPGVAFDGQGGAPEVLEHGRCGLLARNGDVADLARQVRRLLEDNGLGPALAARGRARFESHFRADRMADELHSTLERIAGGELTQEVAAAGSRGVRP